jgi:hypothetical protein
LRSELEFLKGEDRLISRIDVGVGPDGSKNRVGPLWAAVTELATVINIQILRLLVLSWLVNREL